MKRSIIRCVMIICFMIFLCFMVTSTQWRVEKHSPSDAVPEQTAFFFPTGKNSEQYRFTTSFYWNHGNMPEVAEVVINEIGRGENGVLYSAKINIDADFEERYSLGFDRFQLGYFYVMRDKIYLIKNQEVVDTFQKEEELIKAGTVVCQEIEKKDSIEGEKGWHEYITVSGDICEFHSYNDLVETGYYEGFAWERGKGLISYWSGFGAGRDSIDLELLP